MTATANMNRSKGVIANQDISGMAAVVVDGEAVIEGSLGVCVGLDCGNVDGVEVGSGVDANALGAGMFGVASLFGAVKKGTKFTIPRL